MRDRRFIIIALLRMAAVLVAGLSLPQSNASSNAVPFGHSPAAPLSASEAGPSPDAVRYRIDASQSRYMVKVFVRGLLSAFGHDHNIAIKDFSGEALVTPDSIEPASLRLVIKADSLVVTDKVSEKDRKEIESTMRTQVLETATYPEIVFKSTSINATRTGEGQYQAKIWGNLTLHGATHSGLIYANVTLSGNGLRARGEFPLLQTDYKIKPVSVAGGTIKVKDELKFSFDIVANK